METAIVVLLLCACAAGFVLFRRNTVPVSRLGPVISGKLSIIIPSRNEERNLPHLLHALELQTYEFIEVIVVDDCSEDHTREIAERFGVRVITNTEPPEGWTGKNWAVWNGYLHATGDLIAFLDADVRLSPHALKSLLAAREQSGGVISVVPYHEAVRFYERLALIPNLLGLYAFTSPFERSSPNKGLYGSCIVTSRADYEQARGHEGIKGELLDDLNLGAQFVRAGIPVTNYIGYGMVSFRMYPGGIRSEIEGFSKGAVLSTSKLSGWTTLLVAVWLVGLIAAETAPFLLGTSWWQPLAVGYLVYVVQLYGFIHYTGRFGIWLPAVPIISTVFFLFIMLYSVYQVVFHGRVAWKGRQVKVGGRSKP
ncbi:glycosyltransferase involved in cell wall biosynthesis [Paenibacillus cellulosilyticus]|uniref:4,4'-diaponeurosporenoate glycosyltransferase n=1 Tax=Paenibacillus cellulosilyticus TaxID=375489 RepID=A0A2V2YQ83_9BACL|nr:glycosyltransferase family 2 protein [Paenibacillus cellulosilyticus]PWV98671.1 glycosyltransferase involved in cell wall biosynthesis [Paenibacillus cellulosilyticus]QKS43823.1 glycosyltransferase family 2 protein [Paenibacillus cellulosilyticus]